MRQLFVELERLAATTTTVTLVGETGTGKEALARATHAVGPRAGEAFVKFDCSGISPCVVARELFGEEPPASMDAPTREPGALERAAAGTLYLECIAELSLEVQGLLAAEFQRRAARHAAGSIVPSFHARVIASTHRDLKSLVSLNLFREDLYVHLLGAVVNVPPLRARLDDLPLVVPQLLALLGRSDLTLEPHAYEALRAEGWRGNFRQLEKTLTIALYRSEGGALDAEALRAAMSEAQDAELDTLPLGGQPLARIERAAIRQTLAQSGGMKSRAAQTLGIALSTLYDKLKKYDL